MQLLNHRRIVTTKLHNTKEIMNFNKIVFSLLLLVASIAPNFANTSPIDGKPSKAIDEIEKIIQKIDFDQSTMTIHTANVFFMVNSHNEVIVLQTSSDEIDSLIKSELNYKTLKNRDLQVHKIYTLPIRFIIK